MKELIKKLKYVFYVIAIDATPAKPFGVNNKCDLGEVYWCKSRT